MTTEPEGPAAHTGESDARELKPIRRRSENIRISAMRSETREVSERHYVKIAGTIEKDVNSVGLGEAFNSLNAELRGYLNEAFKQEPTQPAPSKPVRVEATPSLGSSAPIRSDNPYERSQFWRPSVKRKNLRSAKVTAESLGDPDLKDLYDKLVQVGRLGLKVGGKKYTLWKTQDGTEFLSEWSQQIG